MLKTQGKSKVIHAYCGTSFAHIVVRDSRILWYFLTHIVVSQQPETLT